MEKNLITVLLYCEKVLYLYKKLKQIEIMTTHKIEEIRNEFYITSYFNDGYTPSTTWNKTFTSRKGAEKALNRHLELRNA